LKKILGFSGFRLGLRASSEKLNFEFPTLQIEMNFRSEFGEGIVAQKISGLVGISTVKGKTQKKS